MLHAPLVVTSFDFVTFALPCIFFSIARHATFVVIYVILLSPMQVAFLASTSLHCGTCSNIFILGHKGLS